MQKHYDMNYDHRFRCGVLDHFSTYRFDLKKTCRAEREYKVTPLVTNIILPTTKLMNITPSAIYT